MPHADFSHVTEWVFDLDNTLYPPDAGLFVQIEAKIAEWVMHMTGVTADEAAHLRDHWWRNHGTTLAGLMEHHQMDPDPYLAHVHDIDLSVLTPDPTLAAAIRALPGRKIVYTNGSRRHAERVTAARGLSDCFDALYGIEDADYRPKPEEVAFERVFGTARITWRRAAMFEDDPRNLKVPHFKGMRTVLVGPEPMEPFIDCQTHDLTGFLSRLA